MLTYFVLPSATSTLSGISDWFNPIFTEFWPYGLIVVGVILAFGIIGFIIDHFKGAVGR